jgi:ABC-type branched-subunit amino acid transport system ATPase component
MKLMHATDIYSGYGGDDILKGVSVRIEPGEIVCIIGPNGAGKSTLLKTISGLLKPHRGRITFEKHSIGGISPVEITRRGICYVPQEQNIFTSLTVMENLEMGAYIMPSDWRGRAEDLFLRFPILKDRYKMQAGHLSGGERQMLAMAMALIVSPKLLLLDEPSAGLSPRFVGMLFEKIIEINKQGLAIMIVEQNAKEALKLSDRAYVLVMGQNRIEGTGQQLLDNPEVRASFIGG